MRLGLFFSALFAVSVLITGCAGTKTVNSQSDLEYNQKMFNNFLEHSKNPLLMPQTGDKAVDALGKASNEIYKKVGLSSAQFVERSRGKMYLMAATRCFHENRTIDEAKQKAKAIIDEMPAAEKKNHTVDKIVEEARQQYCFDLFVAYKTDLKRVKDDAAAQKAITDKAQADAAYWKKIMEGQKLHATRFNKADCDKALGVIDALLIAAQELGKSIPVAISEATKKITADAKASAASLPMMEKPKAIKAAVEKNSAPWKQLGDISKKQLDYDIQALGWAKEQTKTMQEFAN